MPEGPGRLGARASVLAIVVGAAGVARAAAAPDLPPWTEPDDVPLPSWAQAAQSKKPELALFTAPSAAAPRRGAAAETALLPIYGTRRGPGCQGRWMLVGPFAWACSDSIELRADEPRAAPAPVAETGLPYRYYFVGREGAEAWLSLERAGEDAADSELDAGFAVAAVEERSAHGEPWVRTRHAGWVALRNLVPARPSAFQGVAVGDRATLDFAWVVAERTNVYSAPKRAGRPKGTRAYHERLDVLGEEGGMVRVGEDAWVSAKDLARPQPSPAPTELGPDERWIDVDLPTQTLVAYEGARPVYATLVSTGRGEPGAETATPPGLHRLWVKLLASTMDNLRRGAAGGEAEVAERFYSIEDVPYVQFFDGAVALHGAFWHDGFGRPRSHGCVNLAPRDAAWLFSFTGPHLPAGWVAALPVPAEPGTWVRVRGREVR